MAHELYKIFLPEYRRISRTVLSSEIGCQAMNDEVLRGNSHAGREVNRLKCGGLGVKHVLLLQKPFLQYILEPGHRICISPK